MRYTQWALAGAILASTTLPAAAAIHYRGTTETNNSAGAGNQRIVVDAIVAGNQARVQFLESNSPLLAKGGYLITKDGGKVILMVNPEDKTFTRWDPEAMLKLAGGVMNGMGGLVKMEFTQPKVEKLVDEDGGSLLGLPTHHVKIRTSYSMQVRVLGMKNQSDSVSVQDVWFTRSLNDAGLGVWLRRDPPKSGNAELDKLIVSQMGTIDGLPLKMITETTSTGGRKGDKTTTTKVSMEVTELDTHAPAPSPGSFDVPAGYKEVSMVPEGEDGGNPFARMLRQGQGGGTR